jgi:periplasmic protein TonB
MLEPVREPSISSAGAIARLRAKKAAAKRASARRRIHARVLHPIDVPHRVRDPMVQRRSRVASLLRGLRLLAAAFGLHVIGLVVVVAAGRLVPERARPAPTEPLKVRVVDIPPVDRIDGPPIPAEPAKAAAPEPPKPEPVKPQARPTQNAEQPRPENEPPPPDDAPANNGEPIPLIGLSLESTVSGTGPAFATGTSQMGATRPGQVAGTAPRGTSAAASGQAGSAPTGQREATAIPTRDVKLEKPRRLQQRQPPYPATLRAQGIEGSVLVSVNITVSGAVEQATVLRGSGHAEFDSAALNAARTERFAPATRDGTPVPYTLSYTYHFRIED